MLRLRPDAHKANRIAGKEDCLHWCFPGPLDVFPIILFNKLSNGEIWRAYPTVVVFRVLFEVSAEYMFVSVLSLVVANILRTIVIYNNNENKLLPQLKLLKVLRRHSQFIWGEEIWTVRTYPPCGIRGCPLNNFNGVVNQVTLLLFSFTTH